MPLRRHLAIVRQLLLGRSAIGSGDEVALQVEGVVNCSVNAQEALGRSRLQLALASSDRLMRILRPIVLSEPLLMQTGQTETTQRRSVGAQLVDDQQFGSKPLLFEQLAPSAGRHRFWSSECDRRGSRLECRWRVHGLVCRLASTRLGASPRKERCSSPDTRAPIPATEAPS
jgi:hypothetical protein